MNLKNSLIKAVLVSLAIFTSTVVPALSTNAQETTQSQLLREAADSSLGQLKINRRLWKQQNISNYRYTLGIDCFCIGNYPVDIEVRNGITTSITNANTGEPVNIESFQELNTIPKLFKLIKNALKREQPYFRVKYNQELGYPEQVITDNIAADAGYIYSITNLEEIQSDSN